MMFIRPKLLKFMNILVFILCAIIVTLKFFHALHIGMKVPDYDHYVMKNFTTTTTDGVIEDFTTSDDPMTDLNSSCIVSFSCRLIR